MDKVEEGSKGREFAANLLRGMEVDLSEIDDALSSFEAKLNSLEERISSLEKRVRKLETSIKGERGDEGSNLDTLL
ncbi:hypothetical protein DRO28_03910 [Candidatus Bathyarchaeota archaeon]|nr:MAG: hypothetical protein DRO28_03910 [Candidatus Bathyarchaeota archaeon]